MRDLFELGDFRLHSGAKSDWRINEEALSDKSIEAAAHLLSKRLPPFEDCYAIPHGGLRLCTAMRSFAAGIGFGTLLICDDVLTTGSTAEACARTLKRAGAARVELVTWARVVRPAQLMR